MKFLEKQLIDTVRKSETMGFLEYATPDSADIFQISDDSVKEWYISTWNRVVSLQSKFYPSTYNGIKRIEGCTKDPEIEPITKKSKKTKRSPWEVRRLNFLYVVVKGIITQMGVLESELTRLNTRACKMSAILAEDILLIVSSDLREQYRNTWHRLVILQSEICGQPPRKEE